MCSGRLLSVRRLLLSLAAGLAAGAVAVVFGVPEISAVLCWIVAAGMVLFWVWRISWPQGPDGTERLAEAERRSRSTDAAVLIASGVSLSAVAEALIRSSGRQDPTAVAAVISTVVAVILSWALVNTVFALTYARMYDHDSGGGIDFKQTAPPRYRDFAYMAFTVGMAYGVTDTEPANTAVRRVPFRMPCSLTPSAPASSPSRSISSLILGNPPDATSPQRVAGASLPALVGFAFDRQSDSQCPLLARGRGGQRRTRQAP